ncbi:hypothetical protein M0G74_08585 [Microbulbifer sp. CAU 1566]|uniref:DUF6586 family protein n=1 Tax=Microbulbifer sp. CAU 1566 TaxID=2933269 RepID=UPI0020037630|nr:DUF6586 family protein [Microbulbifer sp. CAU 1566]MCK7597326.1 hypothetical protein [Microbulbifer sp. CAU 1566]
MSNPYTGTVASALRKCQILLQSLDERGSTENPLLQAALQEGALLQLWRAYRAFLGEQSHQLGLGTGVVPESAAALQSLLTARGKFSADVGELVSLAENPDSWFYPMAVAWIGLWKLPTSAGQGPDGGAGVQTLIPVRQLEDMPVAVDPECLNRWLRGLTELVQRQRVQGEEW